MRTELELSYTRDSVGSELVLKAEEEQKSGER